MSKFLALVVFLFALSARAGEVSKSELPTPPAHQGGFRRNGFGKSLLPFSRALYFWHRAKRIDTGAYLTWRTQDNPDPAGTYSGQAGNVTDVVITTEQR